MSMMWNKDGRLVPWEIVSDPSQIADNVLKIKIPRMTRLYDQGGVLMEDSIVPACKTGRTNNLYTYYNNYPWSWSSTDNLFLKTNADGSIKNNVNGSSIIHLDPTKMGSDCKAEYAWAPGMTSTQKIKNDYYPYDMYDSYLKVRGSDWYVADKDGYTIHPSNLGTGLLVEPNFAYEHDIVSINSFFVLQCINCEPKGFFRTQNGSTWTNKIYGGANKLMHLSGVDYYTVFDNHQDPLDDRERELGESCNIYVSETKQTSAPFSVIAFDIIDKNETTYIFTQYQEHLIFMRKLLKD